METAIKIFYKIAHMGAIIGWAEADWITTMTPKERRKHINKVEQARLLYLDGANKKRDGVNKKMVRSVAVESKKQENLVATGRFCKALKETYQPAIYAVSIGGQMQFYERKIDGYRNMTD